MSLNRWLPKAQKTAQVNTITLGTYDVTTSYNVTINGKTVGQIGTGGTTATTATALQALLATSLEGEFREISWSVVGSVITATMSTQNIGMPFTQTSAAVGGTGTCVTATTVANVSPNDVTNTANWSLGALPINGDDVLVDVGGPENAMLWNCDGLSAVTLNSFRRRRSAARARIGLPEYNRNGVPYLEYRKTELQFGTQGAFDVTIEQPAGEPAEFVKINNGTTQIILTVNGDFPGQLGSESLWWRGTHASNVVNVGNGSLAIAPVNNAAATVATLNAEKSAVRMGTGLTGPTTTNNNNASIEANASFTTMNLTGRAGYLTAKGAASATTINALDGSSVTWRSSGTITTLALGINGAIDFSQDNRTRVVTNKITMQKGAKYNDPAATTYAGGLSFQPNCQLNEVTIIVGVNRSFAVT